MRQGLPSGLGRTRFDVGDGGGQADGGRDEGGVVSGGSCVLVEVQPVARAVEPGPASGSGGRRRPGGPASGLDIGPALVSVGDGSSGAAAQEPGWSARDLPSGFAFDASPARIRLTTTPWRSAVRRGLTCLDMELRQLRYFVALAEELHFGRAAQRLQISTPTLSQQMRVLERSLGVVLVDRARPGHLTLTQGGDTLLPLARTLVIRADRARDEVRASTGRPQQVLLRVAFGAEHLLGAKLRRLSEDASFDVVILGSSTTDALLAVREESWDAAVVWDGQGNRQGLTTRVIQHVPVLLAGAVVIHIQNGVQAALQLLRNNPQI